MCISESKLLNSFHLYIFTMTITHPKFLFSKALLVFFLQVIPVMGPPLFVWQKKPWCFLVAFQMKWRCLQRSWGIFNVILAASWIQDLKPNKTRWWQLKYFYVHTIWGRVVIWLIVFLDGVETTNQKKWILQNKNKPRKPQVGERSRKKSHGFSPFRELVGQKRVQLLPFFRRCL